MIPWSRLGTATRTLAALAALGSLLAVEPYRSARADAAVPAAGADTSAAGLAPTAAPPWNPPAPIHASRTWETVARAPERVVAVPFTLFGIGARRAIEFVDAHEVIPKLLAHVSILQNVGLAAMPASLGDRTGWGGALAFNPQFFPWFVATVSGSTTGYSRFRAALETTPAVLEFQSDWRPRELFFGVGQGSLHADASNYASQTEAARARLRYPFHRAPKPPPPGPVDDPASVTITPSILHPFVEAWAGPRDAVELNGREHDEKHEPIASRFPALAGALLGTRVEHFTYGASVTLDQRSGRPHWWRGWRTQASVERFDAPLAAFALHSASTPSVAFTRLHYEGEAAWSFWQDPRTFRVFGRVIDQRGTRGPGTFLLSDLATLGGAAGLSGFEPGRFHDVDSMLGRLTYIYPLARYLEMDLHVEAGEVAPRFGAATLDAVHGSYGFALRARNPFAPIASAGVDWSRETVRLRFTLGGVE